MRSGPVTWIAGCGRCSRRHTRVLIINRGMTVQIPSTDDLLYLFIFLFILHFSSFRMGYEILSVSLSFSRSLVLFSTATPSRRHYRPPPLAFDLFIYSFLTLGLLVADVCPRFLFFSDEDERVGNGGWGGGRGVDLEKKASFLFCICISVTLSPLCR